MPLQQWKERIVKGSVYCICKNQYQNSVSSLLRNFVLKTIPPGPNMAPMSSTLKFFDSHAYPPVPTASKYTKSIALRHLNE